MPFLQGSQMAAPLNVLPGPPSHPWPYVTSRGGWAPSARRSEGQGHGGVSGYLTSWYFLSFPRMKPAPAQKEAAGRAPKWAAALAPQQSPSAGLEAAVSSHGAVISCVFWSLLMNPSTLAWERQPLDFLHMPKGLSM